MALMKVQLEKCSSKVLQSNAHMAWASPHACISRRALQSCNFNLIWSMKFPQLTPRKNAKHEGKRAAEKQTCGRCREHVRTCRLERYGSRSGSSQRGRAANSAEKRSAGSDDSAAAGKLRSISSPPASSLSASPLSIPRSTAMPCDFFYRSFFSLII